MWRIPRRITPDLPLLEQAKQTRGLFTLSSGNEPLPESFSIPGIKEVSSPVWCNK